MIYNLAGLFGIGFSVEQALRTLMGSILALIYSLIDYLYSVFIYLSKAQILENDFIQSIYSKVGMILGLFMLFKLVFSLIQSLIDPNKFTDKKNGFASIITRSIIAIVLLGITPTIFKEAFKLQNLIVGGENSDNVIYKLVSGNSSVGNLNNMGRVIASDLYFSFYTDNESPVLNEGTTDIFEYMDPEEKYDYAYDRFIRKDFKYLVNGVKNSDMSFYDTVSYLALKDSGNNAYVIEFNWILLLVCGCFVVWILAMYCVQVAVRVVQLAYLQLIAPVPIISYITDPDGTFKKWTSQCVATFLDLFFRLAIIYFVVTMIGDVLTQFTRASGVIFESTGLVAESDWFTLMIVKIFIIIGLLLFAQKVPQLLQDLFPNLGKGAGKFSFGLNPKKEVFDPIKNLYNNTPLGWAPKALGWAGRKTIGAIDRKKYNLPKPRGKVGQYMDKLMPGRGEAVKNRKQAEADARMWETREKKGKAIYDRAFQNGDHDLTYKDNDGKLHVKDHIFKNSEYKKTFEEKANAKSKVKAANAVVDTLRDELTAAYNDNNPNLSKSQKAERIEIARKKWENAKSNLSAAEAEYKIADERHQKNQAIYRKDAETEKLYNNYADTHKTTKDIAAGVADIEERYQRERQEQENAAAAVERENAANRKADEAQRFFNDLNNIGTSASENGAPTAENSLLAQLAEQAHQQEMQQEFMNRGSNDSPVVLPPTEEMMDNYINTSPESREFSYHSQDDWDERIDFATQRLQELATNGASDKEIAHQIKTLENLQEGKKQSAAKDRQIDRADENFRDSWMSQGGADDSDNW